MTLAPKHQRLVLVLLAVAALVGAAVLAMWGLADRAAYFRTPQDVSAGRAEVGVPLRLGGMVKAGSIRREPDGVTVAFTLTDGVADVPVRYRGIVPDLFKENSGAIAEGQLGPDRRFTADNILAKHDERYMPPQMGNQAAELKTRETAK
ncbi:cytochrome c maturation protein CcmE [Sphingomonas astaxanthinifaciens]|uniref:Cytochrome c-type biogenesis protein CcmE n=1 Tax=Sphingomonas astaxanthinifaciens DSM 22298 TaxID=1123267 RepID=A0ABQ5Z741_9SPHN|nr:cytochrome c maturation protein CcmE [Sphingomonas astaxanthinifaciens]GLR48610.1 cytochrome c-type biogenesis protein CcmE [Sphingomonas astaxanthinifaciens DSM 22298]